MTTTTLPNKTASRVLSAVLLVLGTVVGTAGSIVRSQTRPLARHLTDHFYSIAGLGCIDAAAFVHSLFAGLIVTGISFIVFEWKVGE